MTAGLPKFQRWMTATRLLFWGINMNFAKKNHSGFIGQASIEYIILMVVLVGLLSVWLGGLFPRLRDNLKTNFFDKAVERIVSDSVGGGDDDGGGDDYPDDDADDDYVPY